MRAVCSLLPKKIILVNYCNQPTLQAAISFGYGRAYRIGVYWKVEFITLTLGRLGCIWGCKNKVCLRCKQAINDIITWWDHVRLATTIERSIKSTVRRTYTRFPNCQQSAVPNGRARYLRTKGLAGLNNFWFINAWSHYWLCHRRTTLTEQSDIVEWDFTKCKELIFFKFFWFDFWAYFLLYWFPDRDTTIVIIVIFQTHPQLHTD